MKENNKPICKECDNGTKEWRLNGKLHRDGGPAIETSYGDKYWYLNGQPHRIDGPAIEYSGDGKEWWLNGKRHRVGGPAIEYAGDTKLWYINDIEYSKQDYYKELLKRDLITEEEAFIGVL